MQKVVFSAVAGIGNAKSFVFSIVAGIVNAKSCFQCCRRYIKCKELFLVILQV